MRPSIHRNAYHRFDRQRHRGNPERGFTLLETSIAMVIMMVSVLASASLFAYSIKNNSGANDRELAMAVAQQQMEQLRNVAFTDATLTATTGTTTTVTRAGRQYSVKKEISDFLTAGTPTIKTITMTVTPVGTKTITTTAGGTTTTKTVVGTTLGAVVLKTQRSTMLRGTF